MSKILSAHQPNFLPYLGILQKIHDSDIFVVRDEVLFNHNDYHHRNRIRINGSDNVHNPQSAWINVPVEKKQEYIKHIRIKEDAICGKNKPWKDNLLHQVSAAYARTPHFDQFFPRLNKIIRNSNGSLFDLNMNLTYFLMESFGINREIVLASTLGLRPKYFDGLIKGKNETGIKTQASEDIAQICQRLGADIYLSGDGGKDYLDLGPFNKRGIEVRFQNYRHPSYQQAYPGFLPYMAAVDALFCIGGFPASEGSNQNIQKEVLTVHGTRS